MLISPAYIPYNRELFGERKVKLDNIRSINKTQS